MAQSRVFIREALHKMLPSSIIGEIACFVFYDHHPRDKRSLDVTVCTNNGEILEYYKHEIISSIILESTFTVTDIVIFRNSKCELFYIVVSRDEIVILSTKDKLQVVNKVSNFESYTIEDSECTGQAYLKIIRKDDAVPRVFDDNFIDLTQKQIELNSVHSEESLPIVQQLMTKLTEAKYTTIHNEMKLTDYVNMRQAVAFSLYQKTIFKLEDSPAKLSLKKVPNLLQVAVKPPVVKMCNSKIVIIISLKNNNNMPIKDVCVLLHSNIKTSVEHSTKVFKYTSKSPHWKETDAQIAADNESSIVAVVDLDELQFEVGITEFEIAISFAKRGKCYMLPVENVSISPTEIMGDDFDIWSSNDSDLVLCILATSECFELRLRHLSQLTLDHAITSSELFHTHLKMEKCLENVAIYKDSKKPFQKLHGMMVVFNDNVEGTNIMNVSVYTRFQTQILALMHFIYDTVPHRIIATTSDYKISELSFNYFSNYNETSQTNEDVNYAGCMTSIMNQTKLIREYIDECTAKMCEDPLVRDKVGTEVDLMALGVPKYLEFRNKILEENLKGLKSLSLQDDLTLDDVDLDCMIIDD